MDENIKKTVLRMIPYGLYILTSENEEGEIGAATVSWVTQSSFEPPFIVVGLKADSFNHKIIMESKAFALNILGKGQQSLAVKFFKTAEIDGLTISGEPYRKGKTGAPILDTTPAFIECTLFDRVEGGDHSVMVGQVVEVGLKQDIEGRPDEATLWLRDLGGNIHYGG
jgi:flavin reductase (DIM6/NTAB) family NADH-FMN oxidoreductase RutF